MDKLLLIDDEEDVRYSFKRIFASPDLNLETAASGEEGLEVIKTFQPDLVLMDVRMGGINGLETLRRIRQDDAKLPVIMMTLWHHADGDRGDEARRVRLSAQAV